MTICFWRCKRLQLMSTNRVASQPQTFLIAPSKLYTSISSFVFFFQISHCKFLHFYFISWALGKQKLPRNSEIPELPPLASHIYFFLFLFQISHWRFPECSLRDKFLHFFFIVNVCLMIACAAVTIICFKEVEPVREPILNRQPHIDLFFQASVFSVLLIYFFYFWIYCLKVS